jgi:nitric oxide reductase NorQ protein
VSGAWADLTDALAAGIDRLLLYGPPGTGKTFAALYFGTGERPAERLVCTEDLTTADVAGCYVPAGEGRWEWVEGPALRAWRTGARLVVDEVDRASGDVLSLLLAMADTDGSATWRHPRTGALLSPHPEFTVVMTTNLDRLEELPVALRDRFPVAILVDRPHPSSVAGLSADLRSAALCGSIGEVDRRVSLRAFYAFDKLRGRFGDERAAALVLGPERATAFLDALKIGSLAS